MEYVDTEIHVEKTATGNTATITKNKDGVDGWSVGFDLEQVEWGIDEDGDPITSCRVIETDNKSTPAPKPLTGVKSLFMDALFEVMIGEGSVPTPRTGIPENTKTVPLQSLRDEFYSRKAGKRKQGKKRSTVPLTNCNQVVTSGIATATYG